MGAMCRKALSRHVFYCLATGCTVVASVVLGSGRTAMASEASAISFRQQIRPILTTKCYACHGPDATAREADLRLDRAEDATADRGGYAAIVPGDAAGSEFYRRIMSDDDAERMPPPDAKKQLSDEERKLLRQWIDAGAHYEPHWAFTRPQTPPLPEVSRPEWPQNAIDRFVLAELERNGLGPSPPADRYQLARRLSLDLVGLPPSPADVDAFVADTRADAYERLVDRLLASPHYGERWARRWLDLARYSDTNGYEKDRPRNMWPYRDWVIQALNTDMPFDQFTIEQLAGDMLPAATEAQRLATGFHRNTMVNEEGGVDPQEFRFNAMVDRVGTTATVWLRLTMSCTQCHTHKYDPLSQQEFYQLFALLNNADDVDEPVMTPEIARQRAAIQQQIDALVAELPKLFPAATEPAAADQREQALEAAFARWQQQAAAELAHWRIAPPRAATANLASLAVLDDDSVLASGDVTKNDIYDLEFELGATTVSAVRIEALLDDSLPMGGPGRQTIEVPNASSEGDFFLSEMTAKVVTGPADAPQVVKKPEFASATATYVTPGLSADSAFDGKTDTGWRVMGRVGEPHNAVFQLKEPVNLAAGQRLRFRLQHESFYPAGLGRFRFSFSADAGPLPLAFYSDAIRLALAKPPAERTADEHARLLEYFLLHTPELNEVQERIAKLRAQLPRPVTALVVQERAANPRVTRRHHRGEFLKPDEVIEPGVPEILRSQPDDVPTNRLAFARWLVDGRNPLVARVFVNRQWQAFFGRGIVRTLEDFGLQGESPTHPELLDYLAVEFVRRGWSMKQLHKLIVMSATYQQSSAVTPALLERDPENRLLARAPRFRLEAELVRDVVLQAAGLLSPRVGGPSVFADQPPGITEVAYGPLAWKVSSGDDRFRRGLYTFNKRTAPYAAFALFDAPSGEACVARRTRSSTPLQSLAMLNDTVVVAASRGLARAAMSEGGTDAAAVATAIFRRCLARTPEPAELAALCRFQADQRVQLGGDGRDPLAVIRSGEADVPSPADVDPRDLAAWMLTARAVLNLEETITRQ